MKVTVDFSDWVKSLSVLEDCPRRLFTIHLRATESQTVYEALEKSYRRLCEGVRHYFAKKLVQGQAERKENLPDWISEVYGKPIDVINPFGRSAYRERIGFIWMATTVGREAHLIDRLGELLQEDSTLSLAVRPRRFQDVEPARAMDQLARLYVQTARQHSSLKAARSYLWVEARGDLASLDGFGRVLERELLRVVGDVLAETSTAAYVDLATWFGPFWVEGMHVKSTYPSELWRELEALGDATYLVNAASFHQRLVHLLADIGAGSIEMSPTMEWWLARQTLLLRYQVALLLAYPETFYSVRKGEADAKYSSIIKTYLKPVYGAIAQWLHYTGYGTSSAPNQKSDTFCESYLMQAYPDCHVDIGRALRRICSIPRVENLIASPDTFSKALNRLYDSPSLTASTVAIFFKYFRNAIVHGHSFQPRRARFRGVRAPTGLMFRKGKFVFTMGFDCLLVCWQLLPIVLTQLKRSANI